MRWLSFALLSSAALLSACTTQVRESQTFNVASPNALVAIGVRSEVGPYGVTFVRLNPQTCQPNPLDFGRAFDHASPWSPTAWQARDRHFILATFEPGTWVLANMSYDAGITRNVKYTGGTIAFTARPGEFIYLGDITLERYDFRFDGYNHAALQAHLADYPSINVAPRDHPRWITPFAEGGPVADCQRSRLPD